MPKETVEHNVYAPPAAVVADAPRPATQPFYVVATPKFLALYVLTFGLYKFYWFYRHWANYRRASGEELWPVARTFFHIFYVHSLAARVNARLGASAYCWSPVAVATGYVLVLLGSSVCSRLARYAIGTPYTGVLAALAIIPLAALLLSIQRAANAACGEPGGASNRRFTWANVLWMLAGGLMWAMALLGLVLIMRGAPLD